MAHVGSATVMNTGTGLWGLLPERPLAVALTPLPVHLRFKMCTTADFKRRKRWLWRLPWPPVLYETD